MPRIYNNVNLDVNVRFFCSASSELISSLHVLCDAEHHTGCINWSEKVLFEMDYDLIARIKSFGAKYVNWAFAMDIIDSLVEAEVIDSYIGDDFQEIHKKIENLNDEEFAYIFLGETVFGERSILQEILKDNSKFNAYNFSHLFPFIKQENILYFLSHLTEVKAEMLDIMKTYYYDFFCAHWTATSRFYYGKILTERKLFASSEPINYILSLHSNLIYKGNAIIMHKETDLSLSTDKIREVRLFFSMFTFPHLMATVYEDTISIYKNLVMPIIFDDVAQISDTMKAFDDMNRLSIIKVLTKGSSTNKELSQLLNIAPASVSQHLKMLKDLNIIFSTRNKNNLDYHINPSEIYNIIFDLCSFLDIPVSSPNKNLY